MHQATLAVEQLAQELADAKRTITGYDKQKAMDIEIAKNELRKEVEKSLVESDIAREVALAKLEAYEKMASKDDINKEIREMLKDAIKALASPSKPQGGQPQKGGDQKPQG